MRRCGGSVGSGEVDDLMAQGYSGGQPITWSKQNNKGLISRTRTAAMSTRAGGGGMNPGISKERSRLRITTRPRTAGGKLQIMYSDMYRTECGGGDRKPSTASCPSFCCQMFTPIVPLSRCGVLLCSYVLVMPSTLIHIMVVSQSFAYGGDVHGR